jgi:outer membrane protein OmpA-like peptidoglycan-associated protein
MRWALVAMTFAVACGTPPPPQQLLDARSAYSKARAGKAAQLNPADLHTAKVALNTAESAYQDDAESPETFALSYVALRTAQLVETRANTKAAEAELTRAQQELQAVKQEQMSRAQGELARARVMLSEQGQKLAVAEAERDAAEERAREAMRKLADAAALSVKEEKRGTVIVLPGDVLFSSGKYALTPGAQQKLTLVAGTLAPQAETHEILVEGHTDSRGSRDFNMTLAQNRAQTVMNFLVSRGVPAEVVTAVGIGPDRPIADNSSRAGRQQNRRVEIIVKATEPR